MNFKRFQMATLLVVSLFSFTQFSYAQLPAFGGPADQSFCISSGAIVSFDAFYINAVAPLTPTSFTFASTDITLNVTAPGLGTGGSFSLPGTGASGAMYVLTVSEASNNFNVSLKINSGITAAMNGMTYTCSAADGSGTTSTAAVLTVATPITVSIDSPVTLMSTLCEGETIAINASTSAVPDSYSWVKDGATSIATTEDLSIAMADVIDSGNYALEISDAGCPDVTSNTVTVLIVPEATITDTDMTAKELAPGDTKTFTATADNVDGTSVFTWSVDGMPFTSSGLPTTAMIGGNMIQINSIANTPAGPSSQASTLSLTNLSAPGAPSFTVPVSLSVSNNVACVTTTATVMSGSTTIFPVEWMSFTAKNIDSKMVALQWETAAETNNDKFIVERSQNGKDFEAIGTIIGAGTSAYASQYEWEDKNLPSALSLIYRLRQVDYDGAESLSEVRVVQLNKTGTDLSISGVSISSGAATLNLQSTIAGIADMQIMDARGVLVAQSQVDVFSGIQTINVALPKAKSIYFVRVKLNDKEVSTSIVN